VIAVDESKIRKVDTFNEEYRLKEEGEVLNWFDIDMPEGYFNINDKIGDIMKANEGKMFIDELMLKIMKALMRCSRSSRSSSWCWQRGPYEDVIRFYSKAYA